MKREREHMYVCMYVCVCLCLLACLVSHCFFAWCVVICYW